MPLYHIKKRSHTSLAALGAENYGIWAARFLQLDKMFRAFYTLDGRNPEIALRKITSKFMSTFRGLNFRT